MNFFENKTLKTPLYLSLSLVNETEGARVGEREGGRGRERNRERDRGGRVSVYIKRNQSQVARPYLKFQNQRPWPM
jgi:hypothetical protein